MTFVTRRLLDTGDPEDYIVKINENNAMCVGWKSSTGRFIKHDDWDNWSFKFTDTGDVESVAIDFTDLLRSDKLENHGIGMWVAWFVVGLLLLGT